MESGQLAAELHVGGAVGAARTDLRHETDSIYSETKGVNWVDYYPHSDKPYLLTTSDDRTVKIFDYTTKALIATLEGHSSNVSCGSKWKDRIDARD